MGDAFHFPKHQPSTFNLNHNHNYSPRTPPRPYFEVRDRPHLESLSLSESLINNYPLRASHSQHWYDLFGSDRIGERPDGLDNMSAPGISRAERFEDEKRRIIDSCFSKRDDDGSGMSNSVSAPAFSPRPKFNYLLVLALSC